MSQLPDAVTPLDVGRRPLNLFGVVFTAPVSLVAFPFSKETREIDITPPTR
jgi:hypothetical protein